MYWVQSRHYRQECEQFLRSLCRLEWSVGHSVNSFNYAQDHTARQTVQCAQAELLK